MRTSTTSSFRYFPVSDRDRNWGLYTTTVGESRIAPQSVYPPGGHPKNFAFDHRHGRILDSFALVYISSGRGKFESKPKFSAVIEPGDAFLLFPGVWHRYAPDAETGWHEHWIGFDGDLVRRWLKHKFISPQKPVVKIHAEDVVQLTFSQMMQSVRANRSALQQILAGATANLIGLYYSAKQTSPAAGPLNASAIELAINRLQNDFAQPLDMKLLARELGVSYSWFRSHFAAHTGLSPHQYLLELRLVRARNLIAETELTVKEIAAQTGFDDEHYFSRLFRQKLNFTPSQWRQRCLRRT